jgi:hypothetical protein
MKKFPYRNLSEFEVFKKLNTPWKIQDFLDTLEINFEEGGETYRSPLYVLKHKKAHCMEGAMLAACILWYHGYEPLLLDFKTIKEGAGDHVVAIVKYKGMWGAMSKTNHNVLRYRDPIYKDLRELCMSYFNEYFSSKRNKTLREYSKPFSLLKYSDKWVVDREHAWEIVHDIDKSPHTKVLPKGFEKNLRKVDKIEYINSIPTEWKRKKK